MSTLLVGGFVGPELVTGGLASGPAVVVPPGVQPFREALRAKLLSLTELTDIVGEHVYPVILPQTHNLDADGPAITYGVTKFPRGFVREFGHVLSGSSGAILARVQLSAWGYLFGVVDRIGLMFFEQLDGIHNVDDWGDGTIIIMSCLHGQELDQAHLPQGGGRLVYQIASEFQVEYRANPMPIHS